MTSVSASTCLCKAGAKRGRDELKVARDANSLKYFSGATGGHLCKRRKKRKKKILTGEATALPSKAYLAT